MDGLKVFMYKWLPVVFGCHCRDDRSFHYKGVKFPVCARCTGELVGILLSLICVPFFRCSVQVSFLLLVPMILDGFIQLLTKYESTNIRRFVTGLLFGYGIFMLFALSTIASFDLGVNIAQNYILK